MRKSVARHAAQATPLLLALLVATLSACDGSASTRKAGSPALPSAAETNQERLAPAPEPNLATTIITKTEAPARPRVLSVPRVTRSLTPSGHFDVDFWGNAVNTHTLLDSAGKGAVPVSEARFLWGRGQLYIAFYAGDLDLEAHEKAHDGPLWKDDSVTLSFLDAGGKKRMITVSATGVLADAICPTDAHDWGDSRCDVHWESHSRIGIDSDGTLNKLGDFDEEWNVQLAIPLRSLDVPAAAGSRLAFTLKRCDMAFDGQRSCGAWGSSEAPGELLLE